MKLVRDARTLKGKAICSLKAAMSAFNSFDDEGRVTAVLMNLQHASEMLLKAVLSQNRENVFDKRTKMSIGFERCLGICLAREHLNASEAGIMRAVDALRDASQHWFVYVTEDILYLNTRALITAFDSCLQRSLDDDLRSHMPLRVLPVSTAPPGDFEFLVDQEFRLINDLLAPGRRARAEARARIRSMLAMEAIVTDEVGISERDVDRIERAMRTGTEFAEVFPRLATVATRTDGEGVTLNVHFSKREGAPVRYVEGDDPAGAAALRWVDLQKKFHLQSRELAKTVGLSGPRAKVLRTHLEIDGDQTCSYVFEFGSQKIRCFSDNAVRRMREALERVDMDQLWADRAQ